MDPSHVSDERGGSVFSVHGISQCCSMKFSQSEWDWWSAYTTGYRPSCYLLCSWAGIKRSATDIAGLCIVQHMSFEAKDALWRKQQSAQRRCHATSIIFNTYILFSFSDKHRCPTKTLSQALSYSSVRYIHTWTGCVLLSDSYIVLLGRIRPGSYISSLSVERYNWPLLFWPQLWCFLALYTELYTGIRNWTGGLICS